MYQPPLSSGNQESGPVILRDGTTASLRPTRAEDQAMMQGFIDRLSPASRRHRFFSETAPPADTIASLCDSSNPSKQLTVMVTRTIAGQPRIIAAGSYWASTADQAEVAMAVDRRLSWERSGNDPTRTVGDARHTPRLHQTVGGHTH